MLRPGSHSAFQLIPEVLDGSLWAWTLPPHQIWQTVFFRDLAFCTEALSCRKRNRCHNVGSTSLSKILLDAVLVGAKAEEGSDLEHFQPVKVQRSLNAECSTRGLVVLESGLENGLQTTLWRSRLRIIKRTLDFTSRPVKTKSEVFHAYCT